MFSEASVSSQGAGGRKPPPLEVDTPPSGGRPPSGSIPPPGTDNTEAIGTHPTGMHSY